MNEIWQLPKEATLGGETYGIYADFRDILEILEYLQDESLPEFLRWRLALALFYRQEVPPGLHGEAAEFLTWFLSAGQPEGGSAPTLIHWQQDGALIVADVNRVAGQELRALPFVHWWTFLSWFHSIGQGQLSAVVGIRDKLLRGKKLEPWEQEFYRRNKAQIQPRRAQSGQDRAEKERLERLLSGH